MFFQTSTEYRCGRCGKSVSKSTRVCPHCGAHLANIKCQNCGYQGLESDFVHDRCPKCSSLRSGNATSTARCPKCGKPWDSAFCKYCGFLNRRNLGVMVVFAVLATLPIFYGVYLQLLPASTLDAGTKGVVLLFMAALAGLAGYCWNYVRRLLNRRKTWRRVRESRT